LTGKIAVINNCHPSFFDVTFTTNPNRVGSEARDFYLVYSRSFRGRERGERGEMDQKARCRNEYSVSMLAYYYGMRECLN